MVMAEQCIDDANALFQLGSDRGALNRAYYGFFDAVRALLLTKAIFTKSHQATRSLFSEHFVKEGPFTAKDAKDFHILFNLRQDSDYETDDPTDSVAVKQIIDTAAEFVLQAGAYLREQPNTNQPKTE
ncbi:HEPN domain-containing protein [Spirosoma rhododendri]|uniref:HEPN domain-containing protein n=1 Tax=Spirosoma rhododendri TaxID=2728024 RepID=A0A7L5DQ63_9BACT|nr:HEPN domain-containing protein [Spirosoma rhododendri]QJD80275.1 HEPN domain-containing protein [Spirosoma rhododendri]